MVAYNLTKLVSSIHFGIEAYMQSIRPHKEHFPNIHPEAWVDSSAVVIGEVKLGRKVSVLPTCVLR